MNKKYAALSLSLLSVIALTSCASSCTLEEACEQADSYSLTEVNENYSSCSITTKTIATSNGEEEANTQNTLDSQVITILTSAELRTIEAAHSDMVEYYLDGTAIQVKYDYTEETYNPLDVDGDPLTSSRYKFELTTYSDGRYKRQYSYTEHYVAATSLTSESTVTTEIEINYSYTAA